MAKLLQLLVLHLSLLLMADIYTVKQERESGFDTSRLAKEPKNETTVTNVVAAALAFKATLTSDQIAILQNTFTVALARNWSNLPCGSNCRNGIQLSTLTSLQLEAANLVIRSAAGTEENEGYDEFSKIRLADDYLGKNPGNGRRGPADTGGRPAGPTGQIGPGGPGGRGRPGGPGGGAYSSGVYFISFLNEPSVTGAWMLQFGGHHYAANLAFNHGEVTGVTPAFEGVEPTTFSISGKTYSPINQERDAMVNMLTSLTADQFATAKNKSTFGDLVLGPGQDGNFPTNKVGLSVVGLTSTQKVLVVDAMKPWLNDADKTSAAALLSLYEKELNQTFITFTGSAKSGMASSFLNANTNYVRIDGPSVWIEFVCQSGVVFPDQIHYHTVWRDHLRDYGNYLQ